MRNKTKKEKKDFSLPLTDATDLLGRQSVRTTFRLSAEFIDALSILSAQLGIKQKSLFDHLMEDAESLMAIADKADPNRLDRKGRVQKTFVISRKSLSLLEAISKRFAASRDDLVEYSIQRLLPVLAEERRKQEKREKLFSKIARHMNQGIELLDEIKRLLGEEDQVYKLLRSVIASYKNAYNSIDMFIEKGKKISELSMDKFNR